MMRSSSVLLQMAIKGRAYFAEATFLIPHQWRISEDDLAWKSTSFNSTAFLDPRAALTVDQADVIVTAKGQYPYVLHQGGCGQRAMRIILPIEFLLHNNNKGVEFLRLWSEYRYGVFPEGGFLNDEKFPYMYRTPDGKEEKVTGCSDKTFWSSSLCNEGDKQCSDTSFTSSVMNQHLSPFATLFCEGSVSLGPRHNSESPSKHNLMCQEEGTWFTVMKSPDFSDGKNAAPKYLQHATDVSYRFVREAPTPRLIVAIEISPEMKKQNIFIQIQASLYQFIYSTLPYGSELTLLVFGGKDGTYVAAPSTVLKAEDSRILYVESQPLPDEPSETENVSMPLLFDLIFQLIEDSNDIRKQSPDIIIVTTKSQLNSSTYEEIKQKILNVEIRLHIMMFPGTEDNGKSYNEISLQKLCIETGGTFTSLHTDSFRDLSRAFGRSIGSHNKEILILQKYLDKDDHMEIEIPFVVDESLTENLKISLSFLDSDTDPLDFRKTILQTPSGGFLNFMRMDFLFMWLIDMTKPEIGQYVLKTSRLETITTPVLLTVSGKSTISEDPITVDVWAEHLDGFPKIPPPVRIYTEVRKGWNPVRGALVTASIGHPDGQSSELVLLDDGLGDIDITKDDGIYGRYFTNFTAPGYYNVYVKVTQDSNNTEVMNGPNGFCCGSYFSAIATYSVDEFRREAGPFTFEVLYTEKALQEDIYPPSRVTDLRLYNMFDRICVVRWTAVGDDFGSGFAESYELAVFRDMTVIRNRFSGSDLEVFNEIISAPSEAVYGTTLNHAFELPKNLKRGVYFVAIRAIDEAGNAGVPSNIVPVHLEDSTPRVIHCEKGNDGCENGHCENLPEPARLQENAARNLINSEMALYIPTNTLVSILSLIVSLAVLNIL